MAQYSKIVEATQFLVSDKEKEEMKKDKAYKYFFEGHEVRKSDEGLFINVNIAGAVASVKEGDYIITDEGQFVAFESKDSFEDSHKPVSKKKTADA